MKYVYEHSMISENVYSNYDDIKTLHIINIITISTTHQYTPTLKKNDALSPSTIKNQFQDHYHDDGGICTCSRALTWLRMKNGAPTTTPTYSTLSFGIGELFRQPLWWLWRPRWWLGCSIMGSGRPASGAQEWLICASFRSRRRGCTSTPYCYIGVGRGCGVANDSIGNGRRNRVSFCH